MEIVGESRSRNLSDLECLLANPETEFKLKLREGWKKSGRWSEAYEPGRGSGQGYADLQLLVGQLFPVELKIGELRGGVLFSDDIRPNQIRWHWELWRAGGRSALVVGVRRKVDAEWDMYAIQGNDLRYWREGFVLGRYEPVGMTDKPAGLWAYLRDLPLAG